MRAGTDAGEVLGAPVARLKGLASAVFALALNRDETRLAVVCADAVHVALMPAA